MDVSNLQKTLQNCQAGSECACIFLNVCECVTHDASSNIQKERKRVTFVDAVLSKSPYFVIVKCLRNLPRLQHRARTATELINDANETQNATRTKLNRTNKHGSMCRSATSRRCIAEHRARIRFRNEYAIICVDYTTRFFCIWGLVLVLGSDIFPVLLFLFGVLCIFTAFLMLCMMVVSGIVIFNVDLLQSNFF